MTEFASAVAGLQEVYKQQRSGVRPHSFEEANARAYFHDYVQFVSGVARSGGRALDVGCGSGWSSSLISEAGFDTTGLDLNRAAFEVSESARLHFAVGDAMELPFPDASFDVVSAYQTLEHVPDPKRALGEFARVLRPGGTVAIVGPNLITPLANVRALLLYVWRNRPLKTIFVRTPEMAHHPFGNTLPELVANLGENLWRAASKLLASEATFSMRTPDTRPPFHSDNDACYLCNPIDLEKHFAAQGYAVTRRSKPGRPDLLGPVAGGTWFAATKPG